MKKLMILTLTLSLAACAKKETTESTSSASHAPSQMAPADAFGSTAQYGANALLARAADSLRRGISISSSDAERCVRAESGRPTVREVCALLWATGKDQSHILETVLQEEATKSDLMAVATSLKIRQLRGFAFEDLLPILGRLESKPNWYRLRLVQGWISENRDLSSSELELVQPALAPSVGSSPAELSSYFTFLHGKSETAFESALSNYCRPNALEISKSRCLRLAGSLASTAMPRDLKARLAPFLPANDEPAFRFFRAEYPSIARAFQTANFKE